MIKIVPNNFSLIILDRKIQSIRNIETNENIYRFYYPLTSNQNKIYIIVAKNKVLYIGTTKSSIRNRIRSGLGINGKNGYHGYKWKNLHKVMLFTWCFEYLDKDKIENIEAELAFLVRKSTGEWPLYQNEIHFNNLFVPTGRLIAEKLYKQIKHKI